MYVKVRVYPDNKKEVVEKLREGHYEIRVKEPAERNLANNRVRILIGREYGVDDNQVRIVTGHHSPVKILDVLKSV
jgi:uncharacterized protein YggU (UPF0235/DUF167 family)